MAREHRRLAAIVAADVVGYSLLMGRDESGTLARLREHRKQRFEPTLARRGGRLVKLTGDGALAEFASAVDALSAAIEFQQTMAEANQDQSADTAIVFRIGLHLGDLIVDGDDLYGDGVNVAARLEAEAPAGGIVISRNVHDAVARRIKATFEDLGNLALKNIEQPTQAFGVRWDPADWKVAATTTAAPSIAAAPTVDPPLALPDKPSIAVLPFQNMSGDPEQEYFADGMVEDIITALSRFPSLFVIARNSSFSYKGKSPDIRQVGRELGIRYVLEGSVRKAGGRIRITGQLIEAESGSHLWADRYDGDLNDIFALQDQITASVAGVIAPSIERAEIERVRRKPAGNLDAYDLYLRALSKVQTTIKDRILDGRLDLEQAIKCDPNFVPPYALLAWTYYFEVTQNWDAPRRKESLETGRSLADHALSLDPTFPATSLVLGNLYLRAREYEQAISSVNKAIALNPNDPEGYAVLANILSFMNRSPEAVPMMERVFRFEPNHPPLYDMYMGRALLLSRRPDLALQHLRTCISRAPDLASCHRHLAVAYAHLGRVDQARAAVSDWQRYSNDRTVRQVVERGDWQPGAERDYIVEGLIKAGVPE